MLTFNYRQLHVLDYPIFKLTFILYYKKEPATETNPQQALGFIKYVVCLFVIINVACIFTRFHKDKYCFSLSQIRIQKKNDRQQKAQQPFNPRPTLYPIFPRRQ